MFAIRRRDRGRWVAALVFALHVATSPAGADSPANPRLTLTAPVDYEVRQRAIDGNGRFQLAGTLSQPAPARCRVEVRLTGDALDTGWRRTARISAGERGFQARLVAPAGGWYRLEVRLLCRDQALASAHIPHVGVGEVFVIAGQSNAANHGAERQRPETGLVAAWHDGLWQPAVDPQPGASGGGGSFIPSFGDAIAQRFHVPVGIIATAVGATSVREWLPRDVVFNRPPTLTRHVRRTEDGRWTSSGELFDRLVARMRAMEPRGFRAVLWHQGESDANQTDPNCTLPGTQYREQLARLIRESRRAIGWPAPWFVAQASYHSPNDTGSPDIRAAQRALAESGLALAGPDTDALIGKLRDHDGRGVHFSGPGLREHGRRWALQVGAWLAGELTPAPPPRRIHLSRGEEFLVEGRPAFVFLPPEDDRQGPRPWIFYAPTLPAYPDENERWMHQRFVAAGVAVVGVDVGEAYGNPASQKVFDTLYAELTRRRGFARRPCLLVRSRGGLWLGSWAVKHPDRVAGLAGIYPVFDLRSYPGLDRAAPAYGLTTEGLAARLDRLNPVSRLERLARAGVPALLLHGDADTVVPIEANSAALVRAYRDAERGELVKLRVQPGQGHNLFTGFFHSAELVRFAIATARAGAGWAPLEAAGETSRGNRGNPATARAGDHRR